MLDGVTVRTVRPCTPVEAKLKKIAAVAWLLIFTPALAYADQVTYTYDAQGRVATATYLNGTVVTYTYDTANNLTATTVSCNGSC